jgi:hypothetical protein
MTGSKTPGFQAEYDAPSVTMHAIDCASREGVELTFELDGSRLTIALGGRKFDLGIVDEEDKRKLTSLLADWPDWQDSP